MTPRRVAATGFAVGVLLAMAFLTGTSSGGWLMSLQRAAGLSRAPSDGPVASTPLTSSAGGSPGLADDATSAPAIFDPSSSPEMGAEDRGSSPGASVPQAANAPGERGASAEKRTSSPAASPRAQPSLAARGASPAARQARVVPPTPGNGPHTPGPPPASSPPPAGSGTSGSAPGGAGRGGVLGLLGL